jgi:hypothetical protein
MCLGMGAHSLLLGDALRPASSQPTLTKAPPYEGHREIARRATRRISRRSGDCSPTGVTLFDSCSFSRTRAASENGWLVHSSSCTCRSRFFQSRLTRRVISTSWPPARSRQVVRYERLCWDADFQSGAPEIALRQRLGHQECALDTAAGLYKSDHSRRGTEPARGTSS